MNARFAKPISFWQIVGKLLAVAVVGNALIGAFPFAPFEGDELGIIIGVREMLMGPGGFPELGYEYNLQPGTYQILRGLHAITHADVAFLYFSTSAVAAAMFAFFSAWLGSRLLSLPLLWCLAATVLAQEIPAAAAYANSSTFGGLLCMLALVVIELRSSHLYWCLFAGVLIALGGWCRFDSLALAPLTLVLLARKKTLGESLKTTCAISGVSVVTLLALLAASRVTPLEVWRMFEAKSATLGIWHTLKSLYLLHSATGLVLAVVGCVWSIARKIYWPSAAFASVFIPLFLIHGRSLDSTKYFYYGVPVLTWCAIWSLAKLCAITPRAPSDGSKLTVQVSRVLLGTAIICMGLEYLTAVRRVDNPECVWQPVAKVNLLQFSGPSQTKLEWVLGPGDSVPSGDGFRLRFGYGFAPLMWNREKESVLRECSHFRSVIARCEQATLITSTYFSDVVAVSLAREQGFKPEPTVWSDLGTRSTIWRNGLKEFELLLIWNTPDRFIEFHRVINQAKITPIFFAADMGRSYAESLMVGDSHLWQRLSAEPNGPLLLYRRQ